MICKDINILKVKSSNIDVEKGYEIAQTLLKELENHSDGIGLCAIQMELPFKVFVIKFPNEEPEIFINAEIWQYNNPIILNESCLSFPGESVATNRFRTIKIKADNFQHSKIYNGIKAVAIQHEYDHQQGLTIFDRKIK